MILVASGLLVAWNCRYLENTLTGSERVYDAFWTQTPLEILEFSDMPLRDVPDSETYHGFFPAKYVASYLKTYVESRRYGGKSLAARIDLDSKVGLLSRTEQGWELHVRRSPEKTDRPICYTARKVIDATGLTSTPNMPVIEGLGVYSGRVFHSRDFAANQQLLLASETTRNVVVVGGAKSAADIAYACAKAGKQVDWIIRRSGAGPAAFVAAKGKGPYKNSNESFYTRFTTHFLASWFFDESKTWLGHFLYRTRIGQLVLTRLWKSINRGAQALADFNRKDGRANGFYNLKPDTDLFWQNDSTGVCQRDDFFDVIARNVKVYREDIKKMTQDGLELADETQISADAIVFATGWRTSHPSIQLTQSDEDSGPQLGLPSSASDNNAVQARWEDLEDTYEEKILRRFPVLRDPPMHHEDRSSNSSPLRLYKGILPVQDRSISFLGQMLLGNNFRSAEVQSLYAIAAIEGSLMLPSEQEIEKSIAEMVTWDRLRYLAKGRSGNWLYWDMVPYTDNLLDELGLQSHRHSSYWKDLFAPGFARDLKGLIDEYKIKHASTSKG